MANKRHHHMFMQGAKVWNEWRKKYPNLTPNLRHIDIGIDTTEYLNLKRFGLDADFLNNLSEFRKNAIKLSTEELVGINLCSTDMYDANFWLVNFSYADMSKANLTKAYLRDANFYRANLKDANLSGSRLTDANFTSACLEGTDFSGTELSGAKFHAVDLKNTKGLDRCRIPDADIDVETLFLSQGRVPDHILQHTKLPRTLIAYARSLPLRLDEDQKDTTFSQAPLKLFYCYAREDERLREQLEKHLSLLKQEKLIIPWCDREIRAGEYYEQKNFSSIDTSDIFLALVSPAFMSSDYCQTTELQRAFKRHMLGQLRIIPVILRPVDWQSSPLGALQALPRDGIPVTDWGIDKGLKNVAEGIRKVVDELQKTRKRFSPEISLLDEKRGFELLVLGSHTGNDIFWWEAIETFQRAVHNNPYNMNAWSGIAEVWFSLQRYQDALLVCERVLQVPTFSERYWITLDLRAQILEKLGKREEAEKIRLKIVRKEGKVDKEKDPYWYSKPLVPRSKKDTT